MRSTRAAGGVLIVLMLLTMAGVALAPLGGTPAVTDDGNGEFRAYMEPRLAALLDAAVSVDGMVNDKSRNILALRAESNRIEALVDDIDAWLADHDVPAWAAPVVRDYRAGAAKIQDAIDAAYAAIRSFDFSKMAGMIPVFDEGTRLLQQALDTLRDSAGRVFVVH